MDRSQATKITFISHKMQLKVINWEIEDLSRYIRYKDARAGCLTVGMNCIEAGDPKRLRQDSRW